MCVYQIITLQTLNLYNVVSQLHINNAKENSGKERTVVISKTSDDLNQTFLTWGSMKGPHTCAHTGQRRIWEDSS